MKTCRKCGATKALAEFYKNDNNADGYLGHCKVCQRAAVTPHSERPRAWNTWRAMIERCTNPNHKSYRYYGGRGVSIHPRWRKWHNFFEDVGEPPPEPEGWDVAKSQSYWSLDRIDPEGDYEPGNVRWATPTEQTRNRRSREGLKAPLAKAA